MNKQAHVILKDAYRLLVEAHMAISSPTSFDKHAHDEIRTARLAIGAVIGASVVKAIEDAARYEHEAQRLDVVIDLDEQTNQFRDAINKGQAQ